MALFCQVKFKNNTSNVRIVRTLAVFTFDDGTKKSDPPSGEPGEVDIGPGEAGYRFSRVDKCTKDVFMFMVWTNGSGGDYAGNPGADSCWTEVGLNLSPARAVLKSTEKPEPYVEITKFDPKTGNQVVVSGDLPEEFKSLLEKEC